MRKYVVGFIAGLLLASAFPAYGAVSSLVGKKIANEYEVFVDGKKLDKKALAVDGTSYAPLRVIADAIGYDIEFANNTVVMSGSSEEGSGTVDTTTIDTNTDNPMETYTIEQAESGIALANSAINFIQNNIQRLQGDAYKDLPETPKQIEKQQISLAEKQAELEKWKKIKEIIEAQQ